MRGEEAELAAKGLQQGKARQSCKAGKEAQVKTMFFCWGMRMPEARAKTLPNQSGSILPDPLHHHAMPAGGCLPCLPLKKMKESCPSGGSLVHP